MSVLERILLRPTGYSEVIFRIKNKESQEPISIMVKESKCTLKSELATIL
jgi:hypothetical protein